MKNVKLSDVKKEWHLINAENKILGRLSSQIGQILLGKNKTYYTPYLDCGDYVVVINASKVLLSAEKETQKKYYRHSNYPGGLKVKIAAQVRSQKPEDLIRHAVGGMLPKNKLARTMLKKLYVFAGGNHPYADKFKYQKF